MFEPAWVDLKAKAIPYKKPKERFKIICEEEKDGGKVTYDNEFVYSFK